MSERDKKDKMNFYEFQKRIKSEILDYMPEEYRDAEIMVRETEKLNMTYSGLIIMRRDRSMVPTINLDALYSLYLNGTEMPEILEKISEMAQAEPFHVDVEAMMNYQCIKDRLFVRVSNVERNSAVLNDAPHKLILDLALTYHIATVSEARVLGSALITNSFMETLGVTPEQLHEDALKSSEMILPAKIETMGKVLLDMVRNDVLAIKDEEGRDISGECGDEWTEEIAEAGAEMRIITNSAGIDGASVLFYPDMMNQLGRLVGGGYYIIPSSIHETIMISDEEPIGCEDLNRMIMEVNKSEVSYEEYLSDQCYHYDPESNMFETGRAYELRREAEKRRMQCHD